MSTLVHTYEQDQPEKFAVITANFPNFDGLKFPPKVILSAQQDPKLQKAMRSYNRFVCENNTPSKEVKTQPELKTKITINPVVKKSECTEVDLKTQMFLVSQKTQCLGCLQNQHVHRPY